MLRTAILSLAVLASAADHPAIKIIALLQKLQEQVKEEGKAEANAYGKFTYWCKELTKKTTKELSEAKAEISLQDSNIEALSADIASLTYEIDELEKSKTAADAAKTKQTQERSAANKAYVAARDDLQATISAVDSATTALKDSKFLQTGMRQAKLILAKYAPGWEKKGALIQKKQDPADEFESRQGRERNYDFKSGNIIEMLKTLKLDFEDQLNDLNKAETEADNAYKLADAAKQQEIDAMTRSLTTKNEVKSAKEGDLATAQSAKADAERDRDTASTVLSDTTTTCKTRAEEWDERSSRRDGEVEAMNMAIEVLEKVTGVRTPESKGISFIQLAKYPNGGVRNQIVNLLKKAGNTKQTHALAKLADKIATLKQTPGTGVFDQIKNMIQKMIFHLMSEQKDEDDHEAWCAKEMDQTTMMKEDKTERKAAQKADMDQFNAEITELTNSINDNNAFVASTDAEIEDMTSTRQMDHDENMATIKDAQDAQTAVSQAIAILTEFYKSTGEVETAAWEFRQVMVRHHRMQEQEPEPELWTGGEGGQYKGTSGGSGVIGMLEDVSADFAEMESQANSDETMQQSEFDEWLTAAQIDKAQKQKDAEMKSARKDRFADKLESKTADHDHSSKELEATEQYWADLQKACVDGDSTYAERKAARTQETEALRSAQKILEDAFKE
jgi:hypothetical protein